MNPLFDNLEFPLVCHVPRTRASHSNDSARAIYRADAAKMSKIVPASTSSPLDLLAAPDLQKWPQTFSDSASRASAHTPPAGAWRAAAAPRETRV